MIAIDLQCANGHTFEGWFEDNRTYEEQKQKKMIECPVCSSTDVFRIPSVFAIKSPQSISSGSSGGVDSRKQIEAMAETISGYIDKNFDDVGSEFAKEALKIHYGVSEHRNIRGVSTKDEEKMLRKEGVDFFKIPVPKLPETDS